MEGFGQKSYDKLIASVNKAREVSIAKFVYSLGIPNIGLSNAKVICKRFNNDITLVRNADFESLVAIDGIGDVIADAFVKYFNKPENKVIVDDLLKEITFEKEEETSKSQIFEGMNFVITGSVEHFKNRKEVQAVIEERGGKVTGSVTSKTNYLINNDNMSNSSKNKKAKELDIPIITEAQFVEMLGEE